MFGCFSDREIGYLVITRLPQTGVGFMIGLLSSVPRSGFERGKARSQCVRKEFATLSHAPKERDSWKPTPKRQRYTTKRAGIT